MADLDDILNLPKLKPPTTSNYKKTNYIFLENNKYQCNYCGNIYYGLKKIKEHLNDEHKYQYIDYTKHYILNPSNDYCVICKKNKEYRHNSIVHSDSKCTICNKTFKSVKYLSRHLEIHRSHKYTCKYCYHGSSQISNIKYHIYTRHSDKLLTQKIINDSLTKID